MVGKKVVVGRLNRPGVCVDKMDANWEYDPIYFVLVQGMPERDGWYLADDVREMVW